MHVMYVNVRYRKKRFFNLLKLWRIYICNVFYIILCRVECNYPGTSIAFKVDSGSNQYYMAIVIEYEDGDGELSNIELKESSSSSSSSWRTMQRSWGALWKLDSPSSPLLPPLSFRLTAHGGKTVEANAVLPADWKAGQIYRSVVNFPPN